MEIPLKVKNSKLNKQKKGEVVMSHFCAVVLIVLMSNGLYKIVGVTSKRYPKEVKLPGGTNKRNTSETVLQTLIREIWEEVGIKSSNQRLVHTEKISEDHTQYFYVCTSDLAGNEFKEPRMVQEEDGDELTVKFWDLEKFDEVCFKKTQEGFP